MSYMKQLTEHDGTITSGAQLWKICQQEQRLNAEIHPVPLRSLYSTKIVNTLELSYKKNLHSGNQPGEVKKMVATWNSRTVKQSSDLKTSSIPLRYHYMSVYELNWTKPNCQVFSLVAVLSIPFICHVHSHQYSWFSRIFSHVANRYRKSASFLKRNISITSIS